MLILLPPSEGKTPPRRGSQLDLSRLTMPALAAPRSKVLAALVALCQSDEAVVAARTLGLGVTQHHEVARNARLREAPTARAERIYSGVLYEALDLATLTGPDSRRATSWLAITSSLFGLVRPSDRIPAYRLSGDVTLPGVGPVATFWSRHLDAAVREAAGSGLVVDLRSSTYTPFWRPGADLAKRVATLRVLHEVDDTRLVVSHFNKATKGRIVRALLEEGTAPRTPHRFAEHLTALGWTVEVGPPGRAGTRIDVVVGQL